MKIEKNLKNKDRGKTSRMREVGGKHQIKEKENHQEGQKGHFWTEIRKEDVEYRIRKKQE